MKLHLQRERRRFWAACQQVYKYTANELEHWLLGRDFLRPVYAIYEMTYACNMDCTYCDDGTGYSYPPQAKAAHPLDLDDAYRMLERLRKHVPSIYLCGGEPTVNRHFLKILQRVHQLAFRPVILNTNGLRLEKLFKQDPNLFERIDILIISLDSTNPDTLDQLYQSRKGDGQRVLDALQLVQQHAPSAGCKVVVNCVVTRNTIEDAHKLIQFCKERDIKLTAVPANRGKNLMEPLFDLPRYKELADKVLSDDGPPQLGSPHIQETVLRLQPFECHPSLRLHITPDGKIPWPCQTDQRFALPILDYPSIPALMKAAEARFSVQKHGQACGSSCYLAQNVSTDIYLRYPFALMRHTFPEFVFRHRTALKEVS